MIETTLWLGLGLAALLVGGELTVRGGTGLSRSFGVSPLFIGLTVVAFGSSSPELVVNLVGARTGETDLAFGGVVGSNLANIGLVLALATIIASIRVQGTVVRKEIPLLLLVSAALLVLGLDPLLTGRPAVLDRGDAIILLLLFVLFMYVSVSDVLRGPGDDPLARAAEQVGETAGPSGREPTIAATLGEEMTPVEAPAPAVAPVSEFENAPESPADAVAESGSSHERRLGVHVGVTLAGLALLVLGGDLTVTHASALAAHFGAPSVVIGLVVVAIGTSLPELVTSVVAALRGEPDLAVGNVIGSNLFNTAFVLGITGLVAPVPVPAGGIFDLLVGVFFVALLIPFAITGPRKLVRFEGVALLLGYLLYLALRFSNVA